MLSLPPSPLFPPLSPPPTMTSPTCCRSWVWGDGDGVRGSQRRQPARDGITINGLAPFPSSTAVFRRARHIWSRRNSVDVTSAPSVPIAAPAIPILHCRTNVRLPAAFSTKISGPRVFRSASAAAQAMLGRRTKG
jgi:hypothetical protein